MAQKNTARVITIAATEQPQDIRLRVAAYARVSSSSDEQLNSFAAQNRYYTELISGKDNWQLVDIYADEGITGTSIEKRDDFKRMLRDCERGLIDRILVKSISRFARNTTECLETVRSLKARGISVYFEKEGIDTGKVSGEMLTAVFASLAQAESESISKNMRWSYQKRMQMGTFIPTHLPYGYCRFDCKIAIVDQPVSYDGDKAWNKNMIARILGDRRYVGTDVYPPILPRNEFEAAESIRTSKVQTDTRSEAQRLLFKLSDKRPAVQTEADVLGIINALIHDPSLIKEQKTAPEVTESFGLQQEFDDLLLVQPIDEVKAKRLIFQMASVQYSAIDNSEYETTRLQRSISKREPQTELDADLLAKVVDKVIVNRISTQVILKNGQIINSEEVL